MILYQEQVLRIAHEVAGFYARRGRHFAPGHVQVQVGARDGAAAPSVHRGRAGDERDGCRDRQQVWELMAAFAGYGFPKAHAAGYAAVAYRMAYLKTHYPAEFMAARLAVWGGFYRPSVYMSEARRLGLASSRPTSTTAARRSHWNPSDAMDGTGPGARIDAYDGETIMASAHSMSLDDFLARAQPQYVEAVNLVKAGALEGLGNARAMLAQLEQARWHGRHTGQMGLLAVQPGMRCPIRAAGARRVGTSGVGDAPSAYILCSWRQKSRSTQTGSQ